MMSKTPRLQQGATLLVSLIMLVVLTLFAVAGFNLSSINLKIAGNFQQQKNVEMAVQQALTQAVSIVTTFTPTPTALSITVEGIPVSVSLPACLQSVAATGYELNVGTDTPENNVWELRAVGTDPLGGATAAITQGVRLRMLANNCP